MAQARFMPSGPRDVQARELSRNAGCKRRNFLFRHEARGKRPLDTVWSWHLRRSRQRGLSDIPGRTTMMILRQWRAGLAATLLAGTIAPVALAQGWPDRTITAVVPFTAGAANDIVGRMVLDQVSKQVNQPI